MTANQELESHYKRVFGNNPLTYEDHTRLGFLGIVTSGEIGTQHKRTSLSAALEEAQGGSSYARFLTAAQAMRAWYTSPANADFKSLEPIVCNGNIDTPAVENELERCMAVLRAYRLACVLCEFKQAMNAKDKQQIGALLTIARAFNDPATLDTIIDIGRQYQRAKRRAHATA